MIEKCIVASYDEEEFLKILKKAFADELETLVKNYIDEKVMDDYFDRKETSRFLKISIFTLANYQSNGTIPYYQIGRIIYFKKCDLIKLIKYNRIIKYKHHCR